MESSPLGHRTTSPLPDSGIDLQIDPNQTLNIEFAEGNMNTSHSDTDEGEITDSDAEIVAARESEASNSMDQDDIYEPPPIIDLEEVDAPTTFQSPFQSQAVSGNAEIVSRSELSNNTERGIVPASTTPVPSEALMAYGRVEKVSLSSDSKPLHASINITEDYEPPEPVPSTEGRSTAQMEDATRNKSPGLPIAAQNIAHGIESPRHTSPPLKGSTNPEGTSSPTISSKVWLPQSAEKDAYSSSSHQLLLVFRLITTPRTKAL